MSSLIAIGLSLALLVVLLRFRVKIGSAMILSALGLAAFLKVTPFGMVEELGQEWRDKPFSQTTGYLFISLTALVLLVNVLGHAMKKVGMSDRLTQAMHGLFRSRRVAISAIPFLMGMLPTPGGIMLSAPMVRDLGDKIGISRSRQAAINFFFRHQLETVWPIFPALPLIQGMFGISAFTLILHNLPIMMSGVIGGIIFLLLMNFPPKSKNEFFSDRMWHTYCNDLVQTLWPIGLTVGLYMISNCPPAIGILIAIIILLIIYKVPGHDWWQVFKAGMEGDFVLLIMGALLFKLNLQAGGAIPDVVQFLTAMHVPPLFLIFFLPFLVAVLTGVTMPTVAITFPFLTAFIGTGAQARVGLETLAFTGLICGLLLTPVHLCLSLSATYFETPLSKIFFKLLLPTAIIGLTGLIFAVLMA